MDLDRREQGGIGGLNADPRAGQPGGPGKTTLTGMLSPAPSDARAGAALPKTAGQQAISNRSAAQPPGEEAAKSATPAGQGADHDPFHVDRGQLTFDAEGTEGGRFHTRRAHWPGGVSGVTIGRGYDLGQHTDAQIRRDLVHAGVSAGDAGRFAGAANLHGPAANAWLTSNRASLPEISPEQQEALFGIAYNALAQDVEGISDRYAGSKAKTTGQAREELEVDWAHVHPAIRDVLVDLRYRGDYTPATRTRVQPPAIANDLHALHEVMRDRAYWIDQHHVPADRFNRRVSFLTQALGTHHEAGAADEEHKDGERKGEDEHKAPGDQHASTPAAATTTTTAGGAPDHEPVETGPAQPVATSTGGATPGPAATLSAPAALPAQAGAAGSFTVTASSLNVRSQPDATGGRIGMLARGERITGTPNGSGWLAITFHGQSAFVSAQYLAPVGARTDRAQPEDKKSDPKQDSKPHAQQPEHKQDQKPEQPHVTGNLELSGANWVAIADAKGWKNSTDFSALDPSWGPKAQAFVEGLRAAGAHVDVTAGLRHPNRAALMHYAWGVAKGKDSPAQANAACQARGINIEWNHGTTEASRAAAQALMNRFGLVQQAALNSNHISGLAIDIQISNLPSSVTVNGHSYTTQHGASGTAAAQSVVPIGRALGVFWRGTSDFVHWSHDGH